MAHPTILGVGNVSPTVKKYSATKITIRFRVLPTAVGTAPYGVKITTKYVKNVCSI